MALDHYVSQVHLKNFSHTQPPSLLYAIRKQDLKAFTPRTRDVCRIDEGNTNAYLREQRMIESFLAFIEPKYNRAVESFRSNQIDTESIYVVAGFVAYVATCSPAAMRIGAQPLAKILEEVGRRLERSGKLPKPPPSLGADSFSELLAKGAVKIDVDGKYPQAMGIVSILHLLHAFGNFDWEILHNPLSDTHPYFTSDYPMGIEESGDPGNPYILNRIIPLAPDLATRIWPRRDREVDPSEPDFSGFRYQHTTLDQAGLEKINRIIVRCAESLVFYLHDQPWIQPFVAENARFRIEPKTLQFPSRKGTMQMAYQEVTDQWQPEV